MGSLPTEAEDLGKEKEFHVLVTGFAHPKPFLENKINPSYLIAAALPKQTALPNRASISIHKYSHPIDVSYANVADLVPRLNLPAYDLTLNIGMAPSRASYQLETKAHSRGYEKKDIRSQTPVDGHWQKKYNAPPILQPTWDPEDVCKRWKNALTTEDVKLSDEAGRYLCEYIYFASMLEYWLQDPVGERPCAFLHVPGSAEPEDIKRGTRVAVAAIAAIVESLRVRKQEGKGVLEPDPHAVFSQEAQQEAVGERGR